MDFRAGAGSGRGLILEGSAAVEPSREGSYGLPLIEQTAGAENANYTACRDCVLIRLHPCQAARY